MGINLDDYLAQLPIEKQEAIAARAAELIAEEANLRQIREARNHSQQILADRLGVKQAAVSKLERRTDVYISTLREYIRAMGGELEIVARFPEAPPVRITQFRRLKGEVLPGV